MERGRLVRIPRTSPRTARLVFCKLLRNVNRAADSGFGFEGSFLKPGQSILEVELWPTAAHPEIPILLEYAGLQHPEGRARARLGQGLYILWRYAKLTREWTEIARSQSQSWEWTLDLGPIAARAMRPKPAPDISAIAERLGAILDRELAGLEPKDRASAAGLLHDRLAGEMAG